MKKEIQKTTLTIFSMGKNQIKKVIHLSQDFFNMTKEDIKRFGSLENKLFITAEDSINEPLLNYQLS